MSTVESTEVVEGVEVVVPSGRIAARRWGRPDAPLVLCVPGLSQDARSYDFLGSRLGGDDRQVVAVSPRGRGESDSTGAGTYGWEAHARDVVEVAASLGHERFDLIGWSFGGLVGLQLASLAPDRLRRLVLIDVAGRPDPSSLGPVVAGLERLGATFAANDDYVERVLAGGAMAGCEAQWRAYLTEDLVATEGGFTTRTNREAVLEDATFGATHDPYALWPALSMPVLLLRAAHEILPGLGHIVPEQDRGRFLSEVVGARVVDIPANHFCIGMIPEAAAAIEAFLA